MKFRKDIIAVGEYALPGKPGEKIKVTCEKLDRWIENTRKARVKTWVPYRHSQDPADNLGWVDTFSVHDNKLYGVFDILDAEASRKINEGTIRDVSIGVGPVLTADGKHYDEVIKQVGLTLDPHYTNQGGFEFLAESGADFKYLFSASDLTKEVKPISQETETNTGPAADNAAGRPVLHGKLAASARQIAEKTGRNLAEVQLDLIRLNRIT